METTSDRVSDKRPDAERSRALIEMHLFDADTSEEEVLCGAEVSDLDLTAVQYCLRQLADGNPVGNVCQTCMVRAACWADGHCRQLEAEAILLRAKALRMPERDATRYRNSVEAADLEAELLLRLVRKHGCLANCLAGRTGVIIHEWLNLARQVWLSTTLQMDATAPIRSQYWHVSTSPPEP